MLRFNVPQPSQQQGHVKLVSYLIIISVFKEDNIFNMTANLLYGPPVNTDIFIIRLFSDFLLL